MFISNSNTRPVRSQQAQRLDARSGPDAHAAGRIAVLDQECGRAARAVARKFGRAAIGIVELDGALRLGIDGGVHQHPTIGADAGIAIADGARDLGIAVLAAHRAARSGGSRSLLRELS